jgi:hypothetical protein
MTSITTPTWSPLEAGLHPYRCLCRVVVLNRDEVASISNVYNSQVPGHHLQAMSPLARFNHRVFPDVYTNTHRRHVLSR